MQIAVLDDYQSLAQTFAPWERLGGRARLQFFADPIADPAILIQTLQPFDAVCLMRERTPGAKVTLKVRRKGKTIDVSFRVPAKRPEVQGH